MHDEDTTARREPLPDPPERSEEWVPLEEGRKGLSVMPNEPLEEIDLSVPIGGMPAPEPQLPEVPPEPPPDDPG
jgi:hypothetical protein